MSVPLFRIQGEIQDILNRLMAAEAREEDTSGLEDELMAHDLRLKEKSVSCVGFALGLEYQAEALKDRAQGLKDRERVLRNKAKWLKDYVFQAMKMTQINKFDDPEMVLTIRKNPKKLEILSEHEIPEEYWETVPESKKLDKATLKEDLKSKDVPGAVLIQTERLGVK